jgi:hypothetical protein
MQRHHHKLCGGWRSRRATAGEAAKGAHLSPCLSTAEAIVHEAHDVAGRRQPATQLPTPLICSEGPGEGLWRLRRGSGYDGEEGGPHVRRDRAMEVLGAR